MTITKEFSDIGQLESIRDYPLGALHKRGRVYPKRPDGRVSQDVYATAQAWDGTFADCLSRQEIEGGLLSMGLWCR